MTSVSISSNWWLTNNNSYATKAYYANSSRTIYLSGVGIFNNNSVCCRLNCS